MPNPTRTLADFTEQFLAHPELFPREDPHVGFYTEDELAERWRKQPSTIQQWRLDCNRKLPPYLELGAGKKSVPLYPKMFVWFIEQERMIR